MVQAPYVARPLAHQVQYGPGNSTGEEPPETTGRFAQVSTQDKKGVQVAPFSRLQFISFNLRLQFATKFIAIFFAASGPPLSKTVMEWAIS